MNCRPLLLTQLQMALDNSHNNRLPATQESSAVLLGKGGGGATDPGWLCRGGIVKFTPVCEY